MMRIDLMVRITTHLFGWFIDRQRGDWPVSTVGFPTSHKVNMKNVVAPSRTANALLQLMPVIQRAKLVEICDSVPLELGAKLAQPGVPLEFVYFPITGYVSLLTADKVTAPLEMGIVGNEGMFGATVLLNVKPSLVTALVQGPGAALRVSTTRFNRFAEQNDGARAVLNRYLYVSMAQFSQTAACNRSHRVDVRLARWILMTQDCAHSKSFTMTHKFLAYMLGVRRAGITEAAQALQAQGLINYSRGLITVVNRAALETKACGCYKALRKTYSTAMRGSPLRPISA